MGAGGSGVVLRVTAGLGPVLQAVFFAALSLSGQLTGNSDPGPAGDNRDAEIFFQGSP